MSLDADSVVHRRRLKRALAWWRAGAIVLGAALIVVAFGRITDLPNRPYVARVEVSGIITQDLELNRLLQDLAEDGKVKAVVVAIDSPGGTVVGGESLFRHLRMISAKKPVVAVMGTLATSAGYMTALGADYLVAHDGTITGSIGVILQATDVTGMLAKLGITTEAIKSGPLKAVPNPFEPLTPAAREATREVVLDLYNMFVSMVAERRDMDPDEALRLADGRVFTGRQALKAKLVDALGGEAAARAWLAEKHGISPALPVRDVAPDRELSVWSAARALVSGKTVLSERLTLDGVISLWHPDAR
ncbi:MAG TPA: signal peptide peptidase SppA [Alphaproteobacteria bacterium]|jgi:protease-4